MFVVAKAVLLALAVMGVAATGAAAGVVHAPMQKAIDIHKEHLGQDSTMPQQSTQGQQNALDHLMENHERLMSKPHNEAGDDKLNDLDDDELDETDDDGFDDTDEDELNEIGDSGFNNGISSLHKRINGIF